MFDIGGPEVIVIVLFVLILFGPKKIPEVAQMIGKGMQKIRQAQSQFQSQINEIQNDLNLNQEPDKIYSSSGSLRSLENTDPISPDFDYEKFYKHANPEEITSIDKIDDNIDKTQESDKIDDKPSIENITD